MKKVVIYGGAFSPPHLGHASVIEALLKLFPYDEIWVMPSADRHDKKVSASAEHRLKMLELMLSDLFPNPSIPILISHLELDRNKPTTTYETKEELESKFPDCQFYFVIGSNLLGNIKEKWIQGEELFNEVNFIAINKPGILLPSKLPLHHTMLNDINWLDISSTLVRDLISKGESPAPCLTKGVLNYIIANKPYLTK